MEIERVGFYIGPLFINNVSDLVAPSPPFAIDPGYYSSVTNLSACLSIVSCALDDERPICHARARQ